MRAGRLRWIEVYLGILLLVAGTVLNGSIVAKVKAMNGRYGFNKVTAKVKNQLDPERPLGMTMNGVLRLEECLDSGVISYGAKTESTHVQFASRSFQAQIQGVSSRYSEFHRFKLLQGAFWDKTGDTKARMVAVIDQALAWSIFKNDEAVGQVLRILNQPVRIIGVVAADDSLLAWLTDSGTPKLYIPAATLLSLDSQARITELEWETLDRQGGATSTLDMNQTVLKGALQQVGQNPAEYQISDWNIKRVWLEQKPRFVVLVLGILMIWMVLRYLLQEFRKLYHALKGEWRTEYLGKVLKINAERIGGTALKALAGLGLVVLIWLGCVFKPYIPPRYIPDQLINTAYYFNLIQSDLREGMANQGYIPSYPEQVLRQAEVITSWLFILGLVVGLPVLVGGVAKLKAALVDGDGIMLRGGLGLVGAVLALGIGAWLIGVPLMMDLRAVLVIWGLIFGKAMAQNL